MKGHRDAQAALYRAYSGAMYNICTRMTGNHADAQDLLQEAFIQAFRQLGQLKQPAAFGGWLKRSRGVWLHAYWEAGSGRYRHAVLVIRAPAE